MWRHVCLHGRRHSTRQWSPIATLSILSPIATTTFHPRHATALRNYWKTPPTLAEFPKSNNSTDAAAAAFEDPNISTQPSFKVAQVFFDTGRTETVYRTLPELRRLADIYARDLFTLNLTSRQEKRRRRRAFVRRDVTAIQPRPDCSLLISFGGIRAVATPESVLLLDAHNPTVRDFAASLASLYANPKSNSSWQVPTDTAGDTSGATGATATAATDNTTDKEPPELIFLEHVLQDTVETFSRRLRLYEPIVDSFLDKVTNEIYSESGVHLLVPLKDSLQSFEIQVKQSLDCLTALLEDDERLLDLLVTERMAAGTVPLVRHEHVELLVGTYARQFANVQAEINFALQRLQSKQEFVTLALASYRNRMVRISVHLGIVGLTLAMGTTAAGFFGMNMPHGLEASETAFAGVVGGSMLAGMTVAGVALNYLSGSTMQKRAKQRMHEIETLTAALSDLCAIDYTLKSTVEEGVSIDKDEFSKLLIEARFSKRPTEAEIDLLFDIFDRAKDGYLATDDFSVKEQ